MKKIFAISGSLRSNSKNSMLLTVIKEHYKEKIQIDIFEGLGDLPHFNPDLENQNIPIVRLYQNLLQNSDAVLISTPEYAHGIPGSLKNALDWIVGSGELIDKNVALLFSSSSDAEFVKSQLIEVIKTMSGNISAENCLKISGAKVTPEIIKLIENLI